MENNNHSYDFDFILRSLGLLPIQDAAINPAAIIDLQQVDNTWVITLLEGRKYYLTEADLADLQAAIKQRAAAQKEAAAQAVKDQLRLQAEAIAELQGTIQPGVILNARKQGFH